jgi:segregation and condensation protein B
MELYKKIEALLFWKGEPMQIKKIADILKTSEEEVLENIKFLKNTYEGRGVVLLEQEGEVMFGTDASLSELFEDLQKEEINKELSKASLDTLSIILYKNGASRAEIDYIRGVNSTFILRNLSMRGLVEKSTDKNDSRKLVYKPTLELLAFMGLSSVEDLPDYGEINTQIENNLETEEIKIEDTSTTEDKKEDTQEEMQIESSEDAQRLDKEEETENLN